MHMKPLFPVLLCIFAQVSAHPAFTQDLALDFPDETKGGMVNPLGCEHAINADTWSLDPANPEEYGIGAYIFTYHNRIEKCSDNFDGAIYSSDDKIRVYLRVQVGSSGHNGIGTEDEVIEITIPQGLQLDVYPREPLVLPDGAEPGIILLLPWVT